jgi:hypothetical protein
MNPFEYIDAAAGVVAHHPLVALGVAVVVGLLSTST